MAIEPAIGDPQAALFGLGPRQIALRIQAAAQAAGLDGAFSRHSGRIGAAHSLARRGEGPRSATRARQRIPVYTCCRS